ncbi:PPA1309 family protein [Actinomyces sp. ZJ308]|uniref:PPA1309 family protein n=1 Tax=Actinomyces sp. ZJ308 TaxID=2708342 RepID=UPI001420B9BC|nr:PPA1309 family protein [Actinomyces sp. ZJ308]
MHDDASTPDADRSASPRGRALVRAVTETEAHVAAFGWDQPVRIFALVRTAEALAADPEVAELLEATTVEEARTDPELLMVVEQEGLPAAADLEHLLAQLAWPESVDGAAISVERLVLPPAAQEEADAITDAAERLAFLRARPDGEDIRMVVGVLRGGESWCALRSRTHDDDASVYRGERLVPGLVEALASTFL